MNLPTRSFDVLAIATTILVAVLFGWYVRDVHEATRAVWQQWRQRAKR